MTLEELLNCSVDKLKAMSDQELESHLAQYFPTTRPEMAPRVIRQQQELKITNPKLIKGLELAKQLGIDSGISLKDLLLRRKR